ncbi:MAG: NIPSNAP family protein [Solirubrobacteraceae bacterium]
MSIVELRQYTLRPGARDELIGLFEAELLEPQENCGMHILGTFRDLDDDCRFVWLRGFADMATRTEALRRFYGGPDWKRHRDAANATMVDSDDVLLLRPAWEGSGFMQVAEPVAAADGDDRGIVIATIVELDDAADLGFFRDEIAPAVDARGGALLGCLVTEHSPNGFPALPVREDVNVVAWLTGHPGRARAEVDVAQCAIASACAGWPGAAGPARSLRLQPTRRSRLTSAPPTAARAGAVSR